MKLAQWLEKWGMTELKLSLGFLETDWAPQDPDRNAAWELYVELLTRIATQPLNNDTGDEKSALESLHSLFPLTRDTLKRNGKYCTEFAKVAIPVLNQVVRPFTAKWTRLSLEGRLEDLDGRAQFRTELKGVRDQLGAYTKALADIAGVEDLSSVAVATAPIPPDPEARVAPGKFKFDEDSNL